MGLDFKPRYVGPSPKKLLLIAAFGIAAAVGGYQLAKSEDKPATPPAAAQQAGPQAGQSGPK